MGVSNTVADEDFGFSSATTGRAKHLNGQERVKTERSLKVLA